MERFEIRRDLKSGERYVPVSRRGIDLLTHAMYNKETAFPQREREEFGLLGLLPAAVATIEQQLDRVRGNFDRGKKDDLEKHIFLLALQNRNETLFYRFLLENLNELAPIVYTPTVGEACRRYSHIFRKARGLYITPGSRESIRAMLGHHSYKDVDIIVVTDNERILGLGDLGTGGMGIPIGKLALYVVGAGIHPANTLPISLDVGTANKDLLQDPVYLGLKQPRLTGDAYVAFIDDFVETVREVFPGALLQWEDFLKENAITLMRKYRDRICSFNDDIQGTAAIAHASLDGAMRLLGRRLSDQRIVIMGAGASAYGISRQLQAAAETEGRKKGGFILLIDSGGLVTDRRTYAEKYKGDLAVGVDALAGWKIGNPDRIELKDVVANFKPTILIGVSGQPGVFNEEIVRTMAAGTDRPVILPMSNPTSKSEATPMDVQRWSGGRALVATGSPFKPFDLDGRTFETSQANNVLIFPGVGLGTITARGTRVTDGMFVAASKAVAGQLTEAEMKRGLLLPPIDRLRAVSREVAVAVARRAVKEGVAPAASDEELARRVDDKMWFPEYLPYRPV